VNERQKEEEKKEAMNKSDACHESNVESSNSIIKFATAQVIQFAI